MNTQELSARVVQQLPVETQELLFPLISELRALPIETQLDFLADLHKELSQRKVQSQSVLEAIISPSLPDEDQEVRATKRQQREEWLKANYADYAGKYIALDGNRLLGVGQNYAQVRKAALQAGVKDAYIDFVHPPNAKGFMGGW
ncbi:MAG TPA: hypothetical protein PKZ53_02055 [Acidobacteriota bacterium]|nr:hypothetical protein [Acidobacteriota bacterium]